MKNETGITPLPSGSDVKIKNLIGFFEDNDPLDMSRYDNEDPSKYYNDNSLRRHPYDKGRKFKKGWNKLIKEQDPTKRERRQKKLFDKIFNYSEKSKLKTNEISTIEDITDRINSGELYATDDLKREIAERALALVGDVDRSLPPYDVERTLLRVVAVDPSFEEKASEAIHQIYTDREGINPQLEEIIHKTVQKTAAVASNPDNYIDLASIEGKTPSIDRILEEAVNHVAAPRISRTVYEKQWADEDSQKNT